MGAIMTAESSPPGCEALRSRPSRTAGRKGRRWGTGKPPEMTGRKAMGAKVLGRSLTMLGQPGRLILCIRMIPQRKE